MSVLRDVRQPSASAPFEPGRVPKTARERILLALELGRLGRALEKRGNNVRSGNARPR